MENSTTFNNTPNVRITSENKNTAESLIAFINGIYQASNPQGKEAIRAAVMQWYQDQKNKEAFAKSKPAN